MARVQCFDCEMPVVVDPNGRCPEGHDLGPVGERIEQSLGRAEPHPDEPQPWVAILDAGDETPAPETSAPRAVRPISIGPDPSEEELNTGSADGLLHELHALHGVGDVHAGERLGGSSIEAPTPHAPTSSDTPKDTSNPWDDWDDWTNEDGEATPNTSPPPSAGEPDSTTPAADEPWVAAIPQDAAGDPAATDLGSFADADPTPAPRRAPTVRSEESLTAMAELAALLGDDTPASTSAAADLEGSEPTPGFDVTNAAPETAPAPAPAPHAVPASPAPPAPQPPPAASAGSSSPGHTSERLATVSQLPVRPRPFENDQTPPPPPPSSRPSTPIDRAPSPQSDQVASGETIDWANFTAKGKKRRFGR